MKTINFSVITESYKRQQPGGHWFDSKSIRFFQSVLPNEAYDTQAGVLFITSETNPSDVSRYTIRRQMNDGSIKTVGDFHRYQSYHDAKDAIKAMNIAGTTELTVEE